MRGEDGSVLIGGLLLAFALVMVIGLGVDVAHWFLVRRQLTAIANDAALSGSQAIDVPELHVGRFQLSPGKAREQAMRTVAANPSTRGQASATTGSVTVTVTRRVPTILLGVVGLHTVTVSAHATAAPRQP
ncbi:MAG: TadG family pilus assembly protein [Solirubrobacteraceae bacterium]